MPALIALLAAAIPPLTPDQRTRLSFAYDGRDHREEAFVALVENADAFPPHGGPGLVGAAPVRLSPDVEAMLASPETHRGDLCRLVGVLQQGSRLARPHQAIREWFVRDEDGRPLLLYVAGLGPADEATFAEGRRVAIYARFYKVVEAEARDGRTRRYPAFVGARPWLEGPSAFGGVEASRVLALAALLVGGLLVVLVVLVVLARRAPARRPRARFARGPGPGVLDEEGPLPDDPTEALRELKRRADASE